ncbi:hypothetical protein Tco_0373575 [Tanacetum coccineum]
MSSISDFGAPKTMSNSLYEISAGEFYDACMWIRSFPDEVEERDSSKLLYAWDATEAYYTGTEALVNDVGSPSHLVEEDTIAGRVKGRRHVMDGPAIPPMGCEPLVEDGVVGAKPDSSSRGSDAESFFDDPLVCRDIVDKWAPSATMQRFSLMSNDEFVAEYEKWMF